jgi:hypothetical protein
MVLLATATGTGSGFVRDSPKSSHSNSSSPGISRSNRASRRSSSGSGGAMMLVPGAAGRFADKDSTASWGVTEVQLTSQCDGETIVQMAN